jgi:aryl-alcohol dehydrogenase-like predicted oxidoreductase
MCWLAITTRLFGKSGPAVTQVGLGGEGVLRSFGREAEAVAVIEETALQGITYFDSARAYAGSEGYYGVFWSEHKALRQSIFQTSKSASRNKEGARGDLVRTLTATGQDRLDLWQIHDVRTRSDLEMIEGPGGALEAFVEAKDAGLVSFIGVTGHHDPEVLLHAITSWPVDAVLMPVNPVEAILGGFLDNVMDAAKDRGLAVIGMKVLGASNYIFPKDGVAPELLIRFALSKDITTAIVGCSSPKEVQALARVGREFQPLSPDEEKKLVDLFRPHARRLAFYRKVL